MDRGNLRSDAVVGVCEGFGVLRSAAVRLTRHRVAAQGGKAGSRQND